MNIKRTSLSDLTPAEREVYEAVEQGPFSAREYAHHIGCSHETVSRLHGQVRQSLDESESVPWPVEFVRASRLIRDEATDADVRAAVEALEAEE